MHTPPFPPEHGGLHPERSRLPACADTCLAVLVGTELIEIIRVQNLRTLHWPDWGDAADIASGVSGIIAAEILCRRRRPNLRSATALVPSPPSRLPFGPTLTTLFIARLLA